jgi:hypothetical protein
MASLRGGVGGSDVLPVLGREVVECQQHVAILGQLLDCPLVFDAVCFNKQIKGSRCFLLRLGHLLPGRACLHA